MPQASEKQRPSVRRLLMTPLMSGMTALLLLSVTALCVQYVRYSDRLLAANRFAALQLYHATVSDYQATMGGLLEVFAADARLVELVRAGDGDAIERLYRDTFERLRRSARISILHFLDPRQRVISDMLHPQRRGDVLKRFIFPQARLSKRAVAALDAGGAGGLTMRMAIPLLHQGVLVGYIESAIDCSRMTLSLSAEQQEETTLLFALRKKLVATELLPGKDKAGGGGQWMDIDEHTTVYTPEETLPPRLVRDILAKRAGLPGTGESFSLFSSSDYYAAQAFPLTDSLGEPLGELIIVEDASAMWGDYLLRALLLLAVAAAIIEGCRRLMSRKLARTDEQIAGMMAMIRQGDAVFENVFTESETGFVLQNWTTGEILRANLVALRIFAVDQAAKIDLSRMRQLDADDPLQASCRLSESANPLMYVNGEKGVVYCELSHFFLGDNEEVQCVAIRDVTRVVTLQHKNQEQIAYLQAVIDHLPGMVFIKDSQCRLLMYNAVFEQTFGEGESMLGKEYFADWPGSMLDEMLALDAAAFESGQPVSLEYSLTLRDGEEHTYLVMQRLIDSASHGSELLCVAMDITERTLMEKQLLTLRRRAEEANIAKSQFLARMSHEIRTPMNVILGMTHLATVANPDERQRGYLGKIHDAARNLLGIINDILDFSKIEAGEMRIENIPFSLNELLLEIETGTQVLLADKAVAFRLSLPAVTSELVGDPLRIRQVLLNLVNNAIKFTSSGSVQLACAVLDEDERACTLEFSVTDTGIGIPDEALKRLFTSFQQVDGSTTRKYGGTGLGLVISQEFVGLMGGEIRVASSVGEGSTFAFSLTMEKAEPLQDEEDLPGVSAAWLAHAGSLPAAKEDSMPLSANVLVVEDNEINQEIIVELLEQRRLHTRAVGNGQEALRAVQAERFDLVLMDLQMPVMDGIEATKAIRALPVPQAKTLPIIALTANAMSDDREECLEAGMNDFLSKPINMDELDAKLSQWLKKAG